MRREKSERRTKSQTSRRRTPRMESLENRRLLATIDVVNVQPRGEGSLHAAITEAESTPGPDVIKFDQSLRGDTITLGAPLPTISEAVTIEGPTGPVGTFDGITIDANGGAFSVIKIVQGAKDVVLSDLNLTGADLRTVTPVVGTETYGGGLWNIGQSITLNRVNIYDNYAERGGGIYNGGFDFIINDSSIYDNVATASEGDVFGGGIYNFVGNLEIHDSVIEGNLAEANASFEAFGGGFAAEAGSVVIYDTSVRNNVAGDFNSNGHGAGMAGVGGTNLYVVTSTVRDNESTGNGGGIYVNDSDIDVAASTIARNTADGDGGGLAAYGAGASVPTNVELTSVTITNNTANSGSGLQIGVLNTTLDAKHNVVAKNTNLVGQPDDLGNSVRESDFDFSWIGSRDGDPELLVLGDYGGPTWTRVPLANSPLVDAGDPTSTQTTEQRGGERIVDGDRDGTATIDIGATEFSPLSSISGQIVFDTNQNATADADEFGLNGWTVELLDRESGQIVETITTFSIDVDGDGTVDPQTESGLYEFVNLVDGDYTVRQSIPVGYTTITLPKLISLQSEQLSGLDFFNQRASQVVSGAPAAMVLPTPSSLIVVPVNYSTTDGNDATTGIGFRMHFDSSVLTYDSVINHAPSQLTSPQVLEDVNDFDNDPSTDSFILFSYVDSTGQFPGEALPSKLVDVHFDSESIDAAIVSTDINMTVSSHDVRYDFVGESTTVELIPASLDVDDNGIADAQSDGLLISRFLLGARGDALTEFALAPDANRTSPDEIADYLEALRGTMLDADQSGSLDPFDDAILISRYLFGYRGDHLIENVFSPFTTLDADAIAAHLDSFNPNDSQQAGLNANAEGEQVARVNTQPSNVGSTIAESTIAGSGTQSVSTVAREGDLPNTVQFDVLYDSTTSGPTTGLATRLHFDSDHLALVNAEHHAPNHIVDQVFADIEDWDNDPTTDKFLLSGFLNIDNQWLPSQDGRVSSVDFAIVNGINTPTEVNLTAVDTPRDMEFRGEGSTIGLPHTNQIMQRDVNRDGRVSALDALLVINQLDRERSQLGRVNVSPFALDVNDDDHLTALDALWVINGIDLSDE